MNLIKHVPFLHKSKTEKVPLQAIDGHEEYQIPLPVTNISFMFFSLGDLLSAEKIQMFSEELAIDPSTVKKDIEQLLSNMREDMICCMEYPYVEEYYRDSYYSFYSRKHIDSNRNCFRISFFHNSVDENNYYQSELSNRFFGYVVLRPTPKRIIGYTFLSPKVYKANDFSICICKRCVSIMGRPLEVTGFPYCGQDGEMNSCAENAIVVMFDYFSRRYNKYSRLLPSQIAAQLSDSVLNRKQPSIGLDMDTVSNIIENMGMATRRYNRQREDVEESNSLCAEQFESLLHIFIESGIPVYVSSSTHTFLVIGREDKYFENGAKVICMDDNERPYHILDSIDEIEEFIVPISENVLLNAECLNFDECVASLSKQFPGIVFWDTAKDTFRRVYLTTSRSYKAYLANSTLSDENRAIAISVAMPRFVWVCEFTDKQNLKDEIPSATLDMLVVLDATEYPNGFNHLLMIKSKEHLVIPTTDKTRLQRKRYSMFESNEIMSPFMNNLKGKHTQWQG